MSAFICGPDHFKALAIFASARAGGYGNGHLRVDPRYVEGLTHPEAAARGIEHLTQSELATLYADTLYQENVRSVQARYPDDRRDNLPGPLNDPGFIEVTHRDIQNGRLRLQPVALLKMCDCLEYQSCETEDYRSTVAYRLLNAMRKAMIHDLPGYDDAPWDFYIEEQAA